MLATTFASAGDGYCPSDGHGARVAPIQVKTAKGKVIMASPATPSQNHQSDRVDLKAVKARQHGAWSSGDYAIVGTTLQIVGEEPCEALDLHADANRS
jgi:hypothetical protein